MFRFVVVLILSLWSVISFAQKTSGKKASVSSPKSPTNFSIVAQNKAATLYFDPKDAPVVAIAVQALRKDIQQVTGTEPALDSSQRVKSPSILIGTMGHSQLIDALIQQKKLNVSAIKGQWETFGRFVVNNPFNQGGKALVIVGSDPRGTAYGVFSLSEMLGVSPWSWWADVPVKKQKELSISLDTYVSIPPAVKFRGIFINDEDWGLQPWAAKTFEPETGDIGPKTYGKVFELLLRLKANLIWPAMHPSTKAFFHYPGNVKMAEAYQIVIGSSHAEPMLRNNVDEWDVKTMGPFNYFTNKQRIYKYWEDRLKESQGVNAIYSMGMRGVHDGQMEGIKDMKEAVPVIEGIIQEQRGLLSKYINKDITAIPQVLTPYKEVLEIYDNGLKVPEDITLVWPDDNYGYIQRLNTEAEKKRKGGAGVYYHASYWGRPHDYLWLPSANPALMTEEMLKAYDTGADRLWVLNVGDIKPLEYNIQHFLDMAFNPAPFKEGSYTKQHLRQWATALFGPQQGPEIGAVLWTYYQLAFERRPEFMGWSQTEPTTKTRYTGYNHFSFGDEAQKRLDRYEALEKAVKRLRAQGNANAADAFYQLVYYPVMGASWMNKKFLYRDKAYLYGQQNRISAYEYAALAKAAYDSIVTETAYFNEKLSGGKWRGMMSMAPRALPVYQPPVLPSIRLEKGDGWDVVHEGYDSTAYQQQRVKTLPSFTAGLSQSYFIDVFLRDSVSLAWEARPSADWIQLSVQKGRLQPATNQTSIRIWVRVDWAKASTNSEAFVEFSANGQKKRIGVLTVQPVANDFAGYKGFVEQNGIVSIHATHFSARVDREKSQWKSVAGLGHTEGSLQAFVDGSIDTTVLTQQAAQLSYDFYSFSSVPPTLAIYTLPTHPLNKAFGKRYGVRVDDGPVSIVDFKTQGRSEEWKQNVLRNAAIKEVKLPSLQPGKHTVTIYAIDPGVVLERLLLKFGDVPTSYSVVEETRKP